MTTSSIFTGYDIYIQGNCGGDLGPWTGPLSLYTGYCIPSSAQDLVTIETVRTTSNFDTNIDNDASGYSPGGYGDFTSQSISGIWAEETFDLFVAPNGYGGYFKVWVDWNNDMVFDNTVGSSEIVAISSGQVFVG